MGYNATVVVMVDALQDIAKDSKFGERLSEAVSDVLNWRERKDVPAIPDGARGVFCNAATVIEAHHADQNVLVKIGGNFGQVIDTGYVGYRADNVQILKAMAEKLGYRISKKPKAK